MESEKVKEIKKALECCSTLMDNNATSEEQDNSCNECPYRLNDRCSWNLDGDALTLINELESENEGLNKALVDNLEAYRDGFNEGAGLKKGVDNKLKTENQQLKDRIAELEKHIERVESERIRIKQDRDKKDELASKFIDSYNDSLKQFAERLKEVSNYTDEDGYFVVNFDNIDETLKEFIK